MRTPEQTKKLERITNARLTTALNDRVFIRKLARENGWSTRFTYLAIQEYRRFLFLAMEAGHPVSPSDVVDQVWHLHILHTQDYWEVFCPEILGFPFHHQPNRGGEAEQNKLRDWYSGTLESYERLFGGRPPGEIWPPPALKEEMDQRVHRRVDTSGNWVIPKPKFLRRSKPLFQEWARFVPAGGGLRLRPTAAMAGFLILIVLFGSGCGSPADGNHPLWNMEGPRFLAFFVPVLLAAWTLAFVIRSRARDSKPPADLTPPTLETHELAYLADGARRLTQAVVAKLAAAGVISIEEKKREVCQVAPLPPNASPLERAVYERARGIPYKELHDEVGPAFDPIREKLTRLSLLLSPPERKQAMLIPGLIALVPLMLGGTKLWFGYSAGKPVGYLIALCAAALLALVFAFRPVFRTRYGDAMLKHFQEQFATVRSDLRSAPVQANSDLYALGIGLYGTAILADTPLNYLHKRLGPESTGAGTGCGGGGCSSGGGDGGGGGGGCGGCGGCGG